MSSLSLINFIISVIRTDDKINNFEKSLKKTSAETLRKFKLN